MEAQDDILHMADERRFNKIFWFVTIFSFTIVACIMLLIFCPTPHENIQMGNMTLSFFFGLLTGTTGVLIITNPNQKKDSNLPAPNTKQISTTTTDTIIDTTKKDE